MGENTSAAKLAAEKTRVAGELAYRSSMERNVPELAMLLLVVEEKISAQVSVAIEGVRTKRSIYNSIVDEALSMGHLSACDGNERRKALLCEIQLVNQFGLGSWRDHSDRRTLPPLLRAAKVGDVNVMERLVMGMGTFDVNAADSEGNTALHWCLSRGSSSQEPRIYVATTQDMRFILSSANVVPWSHSSPQKKRVMKKGIYKEPLGNEFDDFDNDDYNERGGKQDPVCESNCLTQVFVKVFGRTISMQKDFNSTPIQELMKEACYKAEVYSPRTGLFATFGGKVLRHDKSIGSYGIVKDSTIYIRPRIRAGRSIDFTVQSFGDFMEGHKAGRFHVVNLSQLTIHSGDQQTSVTFLSRLSSHFIHHIMAFICEIHRTGWSYDGNFSVDDIFVVDERWICFNPALHKVNFTGQTCSSDFAELYKIFTKIFVDPATPSPLYFDSFLRYLFTCPGGVSSNSKALIRYITNHPALQSYVDRIKQLDLFDSMTRRMDSQDQAVLVSKLDSFSTWASSAMLVPALYNVYKYGSFCDPWGSRIYNREYTLDQPGCLRFARNYFSHADYQLVLEEVEASFANALKAFLPSFLLSIAKDYKDADCFDVLFGNLFGDPITWNI